MKKHLGQNFLYNPSILKRIIEVAKLDHDDLVVEIGPGPGTLTRLLAEKVEMVIAIELDDKLYERLKAGLAVYNNIEFILGDALAYPYENLPAFKVVANIPYYITTPIIFRLLETKNNLKSMTLTVQKEVAERIAANPGGKDYGVLSIMVQYYAMPALKFIIPKEAFKPVPKVDSAVIQLKMREKPAVGVRDENIFFSVVKTAFSQRRKMLSNSLKGLNPDAGKWLDRAGIDPKRRPETLSIEEFATLANTFDY